MGRLRSRRFWAVALVVALGAALLAWFALIWPSGRALNVAGFDQLREGMTQAEVEALLGGPPGDYGRHRSGESLMTEEGYISPPGSFEQLWYDDGHRFEVYFDAGGKVVGFHKRAQFERRPVDWWKEIRRALGF
jgi:hypothetical protein